MERLQVFHRDVLTVRSHQWKYYVEPYSGCALQCTYCLYWDSPDFLQRLLPAPDLLAGVERDLAAMDRKQIIYVGATVDPYQRLERKIRATRQILERLAARRMPVVILTKSPLIVDDLDLLLELNRSGLVLVQFTILTVDEQKARVIERSAPAVGARLEAAATLSRAGIPVHFHLSPLIPGLYEEGELDATVKALAEHGGECIYSNILGMRHRNTGVWFDSVARLPAAVAQRVHSGYGQTPDLEKNVYAPHLQLVHGEMSILRDICARHGIDFICEHIPALDSFDPERFTQGIFRYGLPTVYQMAPLFESGTAWHWPAFGEELRRRFPAIDEEYLELVGLLWRNGELFANTMIGSRLVEDDRAYVRTDALHLAVDTVLAWD
jgi:DNA repair photolyase